MAFDADSLARDMERRLNDAGIEVRLDCDARVSGAGDLHVDLETEEGARRAGFVVNCTYAALDQIGVQVRSRIKRELAEMVLIRPPAAIASLGVTVMDGPFFSTMPFPAAGLHSLSHVVYTPHAEWTNAGDFDRAPKCSNQTAMLRDASRFLPCLATAEPVRSIFDVKTVLVHNEGDDGRPILFEVSAQTPRIVTVMGSKIDNVYDALDALRAHKWEH